jgi:hypothetical protein
MVGVEKGGGASGEVKEGGEGGGGVKDKDEGDTERQTIVIA